MIQFYEPSHTAYYDRKAIEQDLNLVTIVRGMALREYEDEPHILEELLHPLQEKEQIRQRQQVVKACCEHPEFIEECHRHIVKAAGKLEGEMDSILDSRGKNHLNETLISTHLEALRTVVYATAALQQICEREKDKLQGTGLDTFVEAWFTELPPEQVKEQIELVENLDGFKRKGEITLRGHMAEGLLLKDMEVTDAREKVQKGRRKWLSRDKGSMILDERMFESAVEFIDSVLVEILEGCVPYLKKWQENFRLLRRQAAFLYGCSKLYRHGQELNFLFSFPEQEKAEILGLYDLSLALQTHKNPVSNSLKMEGYDALVITGANQGGKSTFLRSMGIAQVLCQAGMYVPAGQYPLQVYQGIFTHFTRREDASMTMGKFEEELVRMQEILRHAKSGSLILLNETFATTTEITAYQIAMDLMQACLDTTVVVWTVTHITSFARDLYKKQPERVLFLSAGREANQEQRYTMVPKEPENTSYGLELYDEIIARRKEYPC